MSCRATFRIPEEHQRTIGQAFVVCQAEDAHVRHVWTTERVPESEGVPDVTVFAETRVTWVDGDDGAGYLPEPSSEPTSPPAPEAVPGEAPDVPPFMPFFDNPQDFIDHIKREATRAQDARSEAEMRRALFKTMLERMLATDLPFEHLEILVGVLAFIANADEPGEIANFYEGLFNGALAVRRANGETGLFEHFDLHKG